MMTTTKHPAFLPGIRRAWRKRWSAITCLLLLMILFSSRTPTPNLSAAPLNRTLAQSLPLDSVTAIDTRGDVGSFSSLVLDPNGNPVISYIDRSKGDLKIVHCNDVNCAGNNESITTPEANLGVPGEPYPQLVGFTSLVLDSAGNPVISYLRFSDRRTRVMHCNDINCAGNNESIASVSGLPGSLRLDAVGNPVLLTSDFNVVYVTHCNNPNCTSVNESFIESPQGEVADNFLALDTAGRPVFLFSAGPLADESLKNPLLVHCNDVNCAGENESMQPIDPAMDATFGSSLVLDALGRPVLTYQTETSSYQLGFARCGDVNCTTLTTLKRFPLPQDVFYRSKLVLDGNGNPVIVYAHNEAGGGGGHVSPLAVIRCADPDCANFTQTPIANGDNPGYFSLVLDAADNPVVSYHDRSSGDLKLLHCGSPTCNPAQQLKPVYYVTLSDGGVLTGASQNLTVADEDIAVFDPATSNWQLYFDGSDVISRTNDVDAFVIFDNGDLAMSFNLTRTISGLGEVTPSDVVRFTPTTLGPITSGVFSWLLDGSDVGLDSSGEDIDSLVLSEEKQLVISTRGSFSVPSLTPGFPFTGRDEDLIMLVNATWGSNSSGVWIPYFDGSDVGLLDGSEDVTGAFVDGMGRLYLVTQGVYSVSGLSGDADDIFYCNGWGPSSESRCTFGRFVDGATAGLGGKHIDGFVIAGNVSVPPLVGSAADNDEDGTVIDEGNGDTGEDDGSSQDEEEQNQRYYLPLINQ